jgi:hypothetical protein
MGEESADGELLRPKEAGPGALATLRRVGEVDALLCLCEVLWPMLRWAVVSLFPWVLCW